MERIEPQIFKGPRAYFTNFDYRIVARTRDHKRLRQDIERRLKILLLTKNTVVCAASHLTSEFAYRLFRENPVLLKKGLIIPALRKDKSDISELFVKKKMSPTLKQEMINFYRGEIAKTVNWELEENSAWFRDSFLKELKNEKSVLRLNMAKLTDRQLTQIIKEVEKETLLSREKIDSISAKLGLNERKIIINFRELIYHISGARVVNCESTLPQENYIDYSLADIKHRQILLSELQIFWKIFLELAFETMLKTAVPLDLIDWLSFEDVCGLRQPIETSSFRNCYDELIKKSIESVNKNNPDRILYDIQDLLLIKDKISREFGLIFEKELKTILKRKVTSGSKALGKNAISIGLGIAGLFPPISTISSIGGLILETPAFWVNLSQSFRNLQALNDYDVYLQNKEKALKSAIQHCEISDKSTLLDVVNMLMDTISRRITF